MNARVKILIGVAALGLIAAYFLMRQPSTSAQTGAPGFRTAGAGGQANAATESGYDKFGLLHTRNVFDPDRRPIRLAGSAPAATPPPTRADFLALTGTMSDPRRSLAFFSGSRTEYNKVLGVQEQIAGATITQIVPTGIEVERDGKRISVNIGQGIPLDGAFAPAALPANFAASVAPGPAATLVPGPAASSFSSSSSSSGAGAPSSARAEEIRRRLMEKRNQDLK